MAVLKPYKGNYYLWKYIPSQIASIVFMALFLAITILHFWRIYKLRSWFCLCFALGCLSEVIGFAARAVAYNNTDNIGIYIIQAIFLVIAPAFFAASIYMTLSRIVRCVKGEHLAIIRIKWLSKVFVIGDSLSLSIQGGASNLINDDKTAKIGEDIIIVGLFIQLVLLALFFVTTINFQTRLQRNPTPTSRTTDAPWEKTLYMLYTVSALIFARSVYRVVEYIQGNNGYSLRHEWTLYTFDSVPMLVVCIAFWYWYPGFIQPGKPIAEEDVVELGNRDQSAGHHDAI